MGWYKGQDCDHRGWYYRFLKQIDGTTAILEALDDARAMWESSANAFRQLDVLAEMAVKNSMAEPNPAFDPQVPYSEVVIWKPDALKRLGSIDETDVRLDQTK